LETIYIEPMAGRSKAYKNEKVLFNVQAVKWFM